MSQDGVNSIRHRQSALGTGTRYISQSHLLENIESLQIRHIPKDNRPFTEKENLPWLITRRILGTHVNHVLESRIYVYEEF